MTRVTLRLPDELHERLRATTRRTGLSLNQLIVAALSDAVAREGTANSGRDSLHEQVEHIRSALGGLVLELDLSQLPPHLQPSSELPDREAFMRSLPRLSPPLSDAIISEREDRF